MLIWNHAQLEWSMENVCFAPGPWRCPCWSHYNHCGLVTGNSTTDSHNIILPRYWNMKTKWHNVRVVKKKPLALICWWSEGWILSHRLPRWSWEMTVTDNSGSTQEMSLWHPLFLFRFLMRVVTSDDGKLKHSRPNSFFHAPTFP